jgi:site-specific DNA recombinase
MSAVEIGWVVVDQICGIAHDKRLQAGVLLHVEQLAAVGQHGHATERRQCEAELRRCEAEIRRLSTDKAKRQSMDQLAGLHEQVRAVKERLRELREVADADAPLFDPEEIAALFADFDAAWDQLTPREQAVLPGLLVAKVEYDGAGSAVSVSFHKTGIQPLNLKRGEARSR